MSQPLELSLDECVRLKGKLDRADQEGNVPTLHDLLAEIKSARIARIAGLQHLKNSGISLKIKQLSKHGDEKVAKASLAVMNAWKALCTPKKPASGVKLEEKVAVVKEEASSVKPESPSENPELKPPVLKTTVSSGDGGSSSYVIKRPVERTGDSTRDAVRQKLQELFDKGVDDNEQYLREQETDTAMMAQEAEVCMYEKFGGTSKEYKARFRSLVFNLKDPKNPEFIRQVVTGQRHVSDLAEMEVKEMASDEVKKQRFQWQENAKMALMDEKSYKNYAGKATEDGILKCPKCKSMKTEYVEVQTRSADEPTTKKCLCNNCDYRWKFC